MGLFKAAYQVGIAEFVKKDPKTPPPRQSPMDKINWAILVGILLGGNCPASINPAGDPIFTGAGDFIGS